ncbi:hypothetical protein KJ855_02690 [Patescibacteria group bacterium]|nr:hypothetical protein [Patescibacteria group bacterium]
MQDTLGNSSPSVDSSHDIQVELGNFSAITNGSIKIIFDTNFDLTGLVATDTSVSGGDVTWQPAVIDTPGKSIVVAFVGDLDQTDGTISIQVGNVNFINNPAAVGSYPVNFFVHQNNDGTGPILFQNTATVAINNTINVQAEVSQTLTFTVTGVASGQTVNGENTTLAAGNNLINYGTLNGANTVVSAQDLTVNTNATSGFTVTIQTSANLTSGADTVPYFPATNAAPTTWIAPVEGSGTEGYWGYTTDDATLGTGTAARFIANKWAGFSTSPLEVFYHDAPVDGTGTGTGITRVGHQLQITNFQESGTYTSTMTYVCTAVY